MYITVYGDCIARENIVIHNVPATVKSRGRSGDLGNGLVPCVLDFTLFIYVSISSRSHKPGARHRVPFGSFTNIPDRPGLLIIRIFCRYRQHANKQLQEHGNHQHKNDPFLNRFQHF
jgi:hypothetical protein